MVDLATLVGIAWLGLSAFGFFVGIVLGGPSRRGRGAWAIVGLLFAPAVLLLLVRRARGQGGLGELPEGEGYPQPASPMPVPALADLEGVPEPVTACPNCAFLGIRAPGVQDGVWAGGGELVGVVCPRCGYRGVPAEFPRREDYRSFVASFASADA
jgi:hypothetical protein